MNVPAPEPNGPSFRTVMQCRGQRQDGEAFLADIWFSTYRTSVGSRLAAMVVDTSEDLRNREEFSLHQLLAASRILVGAVSHEVRNVCGAIAVVHENLARNSSLAHNKDFEALGTLIQALEKIAALELRQTAYPGRPRRSAGSAGRTAHRHRAGAARRGNRRVLGHRTRPAGGLGRPAKPDAGLPEPHQKQPASHAGSTVPAPAQDRRPAPKASASRSAFRIPAAVSMHPEHLFRPFQPGAQSTGLGVYLSRALHAILPRRSAL